MSTDKYLTQGEACLMGEKQNDYFAAALNDFASDVAYGDSIRSLAKKGMTVAQISQNLTYPLGLDKVGEIVWKYYIQAGIILLDKPTENMINATQIKYVIDRDKYGRKSYRRVEEVIPGDKREYVPCDFGKNMYSDKDKFSAFLNMLDPGDKEYIIGIPWPLTTVYHIKDDRMARIIGIYHSLSW